MKCIRIPGLVLVAVFAIAAITAASASATNPSWYECAKEEGGKFVKGCAHEAGGGEKGGYTVKPGVGSGKEAKTKGGAGALHVVIPAPKEGEKEHPSGDIKVKCEKLKGVIKPVLPKGVVKVALSFSKCSALGAPCQSGEKKGTVVTNSLSGELGDLEEGPEGPGGVGILLRAEAGPETPLASFTCTELASTVVFGSVIGLQEGNINHFAKETTTTFSVGPFLGEPFAGYKPLVNRTHFAGEPAGSHYLVSAITEAGSEETNMLPAGQEGTGTNKGEKNVEIKD
jgi:hypothetical protein